jgi:hypothetical protein
MLYLARSCAFNWARRKVILSSGEITISTSCNKRPHSQSADCCLRPSAVHWTLVPPHSTRLNGGTLQEIANAL